MTQEALRMALEALEWCHGGEPIGTEEAIAAIKEALAQPAQEPVAWIGEISEGAELMLEKPKFRAVPVYTAPPQRQPLTDEEIFFIKYKWITTPFVGHLDFARLVEAAHGIGDKT